MAWVARTPTWYAVCPDCGTNVKGRLQVHYGRGDGGSTRKIAKDALYDHRRNECEQGRVETAPS